jgi:hypothetical protein
MDEAMPAVAGKQHRKITDIATDIKGDVVVFEDGFEKPEICNSLISVKSIIYKKSDEEKRQKIFKELVGDIMMVQTENQDSKDKLIKEFYQRFEAELRRPPTKQEIMDNLMQDELSITEEQIDEYLVGVTPYDPVKAEKGVPVRSIGLSLPRNAEPVTNLPYRGNPT